ncbi:MAG: hypothetical protein [Bacteriophage sp.]|nr:MAG: hypothetical protein [Bacteriophage sp.]
MGQKTKKLKLRAFSNVVSGTNNDENKAIKSAPKTLAAEFNEKLEHTTSSQERMIPLNESKSDTEYDLCCTFKESVYDQKTYLFGTMLRIKKAEDVGDIPEELLAKKKFDISAILTGKKGNNSFSEINSFYFLMRGKHVVCTLQTNRTIKSFEAYINKLLKTQKNQLCPKLVKQGDLKISDVRDITFGSTSSVTTGTKNSTTQQRKLINISVETLADFMKDEHSQVLSDVDLANVLTAKLILKIKKPRKMSDVEFERKYGAILRVVQDTDDITITDKDGKKIKGSDIELRKEIEIDLTENGMLNEIMLESEMVKFINDLEHAPAD